LDKPNGQSSELPESDEGLNLEQRDGSPSQAFRRAGGKQRLQGALGGRGSLAYSLVMWQTVALSYEQSHLMAGLMLGLLSTSVVSTATPLQGSPLMFHAGDARRPHRPRIVFSAAAARLHTHGIMHPGTNRKFSKKNIIFSERRSNLPHRSNSYTENDGMVYL